MQKTIYKPYDDLIQFKDLKEKELQPIRYFKTGVSGIDTNLGGIPSGGYTLIVGTTKSGKSMVMLHLAALMSNIDNYTVLYFSCENDERVDKQRLIQAERIYDEIYDSPFYKNLLDKKEGLDNIIKRMRETIISVHPDIVFIDGPERLIKSNGDGADLYENGKKFTDMLSDLAVELDCAILMSWQTSRGNKSKKIEEITSDDVSCSIAASRDCVAEFVVHRDTKDNWKMKIMLSRFDYDNERPFEVFDKGSGVFRLK